MLGPFVLLRKLGAGSFAQVWLANEVYLGTVVRTVALKLFPSQTIAAGDGSPRSGSGGSSRDTVVEEARLLCQVEHPNVVRFHTLTVDREKGVVALVMEYVAGTSIKRLLEDRDTLSVNDVLGVGIAVASALSAVHAAGLVHRDVNPANVVESGGVYKLIDFGIAAAMPKRFPDGVRPKRAPPGEKIPLELAGAKASTLTVPESEAGSGPPSVGMAGTVGFIDPVCLADEQIATTQSDLYSLGALLFTCLTGKVPAAATSDGAGLKRGVLYGSEAAPPVRSVQPDVPAPLAALVDALLAPSRAKRPRMAEQIAKELEAIRAELTGRKRVLPPEEIGPFRGLQRFESEDRDVYFGRTAELASAVEAMRARPILTLVGHSGSGKSSLARAGLLPAIADGALQGWPRKWDSAIACPGANPKASVCSALSPFVPRAHFLAPEALVDALVERVESQNRGFVLLLDQAEEITTVSEGKGRDWVVEWLERMGAQMRPGLRVIVAVRQDLIQNLLTLGRLGRTLVQATHIVAPLSEAAWSQVIDQALAAYGYAFEDDALREEVLAEIRPAVSAMPLVQFALSELWQQRDRKRKMLTRRGHTAIGGVAGALDRHADAALGELHEVGPTASSVARSILLELTTAQGTRTSLPLTELENRIGSPIVAIVAERLEAARLIVRDAGGMTLAHETLLEHWWRLRAWVEDAKQDRELAEEISHDAAKWSKERDPTLLWKKRRLLGGTELARRGLLNDAALAFVRAGERAERRAKVIAACLVALLVAIAGSAGAKYVSDQNKSEMLARSSQMVAQKNERAARRNEKRSLDEKARAEGALLEVDRLTERLSKAKSPEECLSAAKALAEAPTQEARTGTSAAASKPMTVEAPSASDTVATAAAPPAAASVESPEPEPGYFNRPAAISALNAAAGAISGCAEPDGPRGTGRVSVTFAPTGRVTWANIEGPPFAGTSVGGCIAARFRAASVPPFAGSPITVHKSFSLW